MNDNEKALQRFVTLVGQCAEECDKIQRALDEHLDVWPDSCHWGNVGDAAHILQLLRVVTAHQSMQEE